MVIRRATNADIPRIIEMGTNFRDQTRYARMIDLDPSSTATTAHGLVNGDGSVVLVAEGHVPPLDTALVGMLGLTTYVHPLSGELTAGELFWWVEPDHRGTTGLRLLHAGEQWARDAGAKKLWMIAPNSGIEGIYRRMGYTRVEVNYCKGLTA